MIPKVGPVLFAVGAVNGQTLAPGQTVTGVFRWPRDLFATGIFVMPQSGDPADLAGLEVQIQDETFQDVFTDGQGTSFTAPGMALCAGAGGETGFRTFPLQHAVMSGDCWVVSVTNNAARDVVPKVFFHFDEAYDAAG